MMIEIVRFMNQESVIILTLLCFCACTFWLKFFRKELNLGWIAIIIFAILDSVIGLLCTRILAIIEVGGNINEAANMRLFGKVFFIPFFHIIGSKLFGKDIKRIFDIVGVLLAIGFIFGRIDCLICGCCSGTVVFGENTIYLPLREIEILYYVAFMVYYCPRIVRKQTYGQVYPVFMIEYGLLRFVMEWFRKEYTTQVGIFHLAHIWCIVSVVVGIVWLLILRKKEAKANKANS